MTKNMNQGAINAFVVFIAVSIFLAFTVGLAWWAWSWSTHTLAWAIFVFGSILGGIGRVKVK